MYSCRTHYLVKTSVIPSQKDQTVGAVVQEGHVLRSRRPSPAVEFDDRFKRLDRFQTSCDCVPIRICCTQPVFWSPISWQTAQKPPNFPVSPQALHNDQIFSLRIRVPMYDCQHREVQQAAVTRSDKIQQRPKTSGGSNDWHYYNLLSSDSWPGPLHISLLVYGRTLVAKCLTRCSKFYAPTKVVRFYDWKRSSQASNRRLVSEKSSNMLLSPIRRRCYLAPVMLHRTKADGVYGMRADSKIGPF